MQEHHRERARVACGGGELLAEREGADDGVADAALRGARDGRLRLAGVGRRDVGADGAERAACDAPGHPEHANDCDRRGRGGVLQDAEAGHARRVGDVRARARHLHDVVLLCRQVRGRGHVHVERARVGHGRNADGHVDASGRHRVHAACAGPGPVRARARHRLVVDDEAVVPDVRLRERVRGRAVHEEERARRDLDLQVTGGARRVVLRLVGDAEGVQADARARRCGVARAVRDDDPTLPDLRGRHRHLENLRERVLADLLLLPRSCECGHDLTLPSARRVARASSRASPLR